jgi:transaldolase
MRLFLDTASIDEIREINRWGVLSGVTTNPSLVAKEHEAPELVWKQILEEVPGDISLETTALDAEEMYQEGVQLSQMAAHAQAILAAEIGAYIVSPFVGRLDDVGSDGMALLRSICDLYAVQGYDTNVLAASLRHPMHVVESALAGADIATMPYDVFTKLVKHPLTDSGLERFLADWATLKGELEGEA